MDTFRIVLQKDQYHISDPNRFTPSLRTYSNLNSIQIQAFNKEYKGVRQFRQNQTNDTRAFGLVYPNLTIYERIRESQYSLDLHIQLSLPKMLFGESITEFTDCSMVDLIPILISRLKDMGVDVTGEALRNARVVTAHYARNVLFKSEGQMTDLIHKLSLCSMGQWYEGNRKTYANDGYAVRFHAKIFEMVFYHKYRDLMGTGKSIDSHKTVQEKRLAQQVKDKNDIPPLLRYEVRINGSKSIKRRMYEAINIEKDYWTFAELVNDEMCQKILESNWSKLKSKPENLLILQSVDFRATVSQVLHQYGGYPPRVIAEGMGYFFMLHFLGVKHLRNHVIKQSSRQAWYRTVKKIVAFAKKYAKSTSHQMDPIDKIIGTNDIQDMLPLS